MYITPTDVKEYSEFGAVQNRPDSKLEKDILRAETEIFAYCGHRFDDAIKYPSGPPEEVKLAIILLAEYYALTSGDESMVKGYKSEKIGDYSYTLADGRTIEKPSISTLLVSHVIESGNIGGNQVRMRMRAI
jgi:hypothetical protein